MDVAEASARGPVENPNVEGPGATNRTGPSVFLHGSTKTFQTMNERTMTTRSLLTFRETKGVDGSHLLPSG